MNDIAKRKVVEKLFSSIKMEGITQIEVAKMFKVDGASISSMKNPKLWKHVVQKTWDIFLQWVNSGQKLREYSKKHGKFMPEKETITLSGTKSDVPIEEQEQVKQELVNNLGPIRVNKVSFVDMLIKERAMLKVKIEAIDLLLEHYT